MNIDLQSETNLCSQQGYRRIARKLGWMGPMKPNAHVSRPGIVGSDESETYETVDPDQIGVSRFTFSQCMRFVSLMNQ